MQCWFDSSQPHETFTSFQCVPFASDLAYTMRNEKWMEKTKHGNIHIITMSHNVWYVPPKMWKAIIIWYVLQSTIPFHFIFKYENCQRALHVSEQLQNIISNSMPFLHTKKYFRNFSISNQIKILLPAIYSTTAIAILNNQANVYSETWCTIIFSSKLHLRWNSAVYIKWQACFNIGFLDHFSLKVPRVKAITSKYHWLCDRVLHMSYMFVLFTRCILIFIFHPNSSFQSYSHKGLRKALTCNKTQQTQCNKR